MVLHCGSNMGYITLIKQQGSVCGEHFWQTDALCCSVSQTTTEPDTPVKLHLISSVVSMIRFPDSADQLAAGQASSYALYQSLCLCA